MLDRIVSRLFFRASHHYIPSHKHELIVQAPWGNVQIWREYHLPAGAPDTEPRYFVLRFLGSRGRAEMATLDPADRLANIAAEVWTMNAPGFGNSEGPTSLARYADAARLAAEAILKHAGSRPVWVTGKSLGTAAALHVCAHYAVAGLILRNPMPLRELILRRYGWWNLWLPAWLVARQIPRSLDSLANAKRSNCPALFLISRDDLIVPPTYQQQLVAAYGGTADTLSVAVGHDVRELLPDDAVRYGGALDALMMPRITAKA